MLQRLGPRAALVPIVIVLIGVAGWVRPTKLDLPSPVWADRARMISLDPTAATALWIRAAQRFGAAALVDNQALNNIDEALEQDLTAATALDASFEDPWLGGTLMLRITGENKAFAERGRAERPDLPWHLLGVEVPR